MFVSVSEMFLQNAFLQRKRKHDNVIKVKEKRINDIPLDYEVKLTFHYNQKLFDNNQNFSTSESEVTGVRVDTNCVRRR